MGRRLNIALDVVPLGVYSPNVISYCEAVAAGSGTRGEGVALVLATHEVSAWILTA